MMGSGALRQSLAGMAAERPARTGVGVAAPDLQADDFAKQPLRVARLTCAKRVRVSHCHRHLDVQENRYAT